MLFAIIAVIALIADQWLKYWVTINITLSTGEHALIPGVIKLVNIHNKGAAFGLLDNVSWARWAFLGLAAVFLIVIIVVLARRVFKSKFANWCLVLAIAGTIGNCIDRLLYGYVVDMFKVEFVNFAVFNIADVILVVSCLLFIIYLFVGDKDEDEDEEEDEEPVSDEETDVMGIDSAAPEFPAEATPLVPDDAEKAKKKADEENIGNADFWAGFKKELHSDKPAADMAPKKEAPAVEAKPEPVKEPVKAEPVKPAEPPKAKPAPAEEIYNLEDILNEFR